MGRNLEGEITRQGWEGVMLSRESAGDSIPEPHMLAPENGWLEYSCPFGARPIFRCELLVLGCFREFTLQGTNMSPAKACLSR